MVPQNYSGTVRPSFTGYAFTPHKRTYTNVNADINGQDYTAVEAKLRLEYKTEQPTNTWNIQAVLFIYNDGTTTLNIKDITAEYWYKSEWPDEEKAEVDDARVHKYGTGGRYIGYPITYAVAQQVIPAQGGQDRKAVVRFTAAAGVLEPGAWIEVKFRVHDKQWRKQYNFRNDYSFGSHSNLKPWTRIPVTYLGSRVWGTEP
jgi:endoglucanase